MDVPMEDQDDGVAAMVGQTPGAAFGVDDIESRSGPADRGTFEHGHQSRSRRSASDGVTQSPS
jgi:hypothetical protein